MVIRLGVTGLKKTELGYLLDLFGGMGEEGWCDLVYVKSLSMIRLMVVLLMPLSCMVSMVLVLWVFKDKIMHFREVKCQEFDIKYKVFYNIHIERITVACGYSRYHIRLRFTVV